MAGCESDNVDYMMYDLHESSNDDNSPPALSITIPKTSDLVRTSKRWAEVQLPIDILLLAVKDDDFLSCYYFLSDVFRSFTTTLGYVYFGKIGNDGEVKLKVALITCSEGGGEPGGSAMVVNKAVEVLQPKAVLCIGSCRGLYRDKTKLGDVVVPSKLTTYASRRMTSTGVVPCGFTTPLSSIMSRLIRQAGFGWKPPLENPEVGEVKVHHDIELLSGPEQVESSQRRDELVGLYSNAIAVELDGDGIFAAAHDLKTEWVVIKGVSGYADCAASLTKEWVSFASVMAASVMYNILSDTFVFEQWPHYQNPINSSQRTRNEESFSHASVQLRSERPQVTSTQNGQHQNHGQGFPGPFNGGNFGNTGNLLGSLFQTYVGSCASGQMNYEGRIFCYSAYGRFHSLREPLVYDASASDQNSGISVEAKHYDNDQEAIRHAVEKLKGRLQEKGII